MFNLGSSGRLAAEIREVLEAGERDPAFHLGSFKERSRQML